jgi:hypothetical protein
MTGASASLALATIALHVPAVIGALTYYVSPDGTGSGTSRSSPFGSLGEAQDAVRASLADGEEDITVQLASGLYVIEETLNLTSQDSGSPGHPVVWKADEAGDVVISGGLKVSNWTDTGSKGIYSASVPSGTKSRNLYVNGKAANYARRMIERSDFNTTNSSMLWESSDYDWIMEAGDLDGAEIRAVQAFTDRIAPIERVLDREMLMTRPSWDNNIIGYDTFSNPDGFYNVDFLTWIQGALSLLEEGGGYYLDSENGTVYYIPLEGEDMETLDAWLGVKEALVTFAGTYDEPVHDIAFEDISFAHTTWLKPGEGYGYVDQQTGGYIGANTTYPEFEATRPHWHQMPAAIQISAAHDISFTGGNYTQMGACGFGIGNDDNAYVSQLGLGTRNVSVVGGYFTQVMGNSIMVGGIQANAHHPSDPRMLNSHITISENVFWNTSSLISSTVPIMFTYTQYSTISNNDVSNVPYSGMTHGYGWGSNDAGGSPEYIKRGLYNYQPLYQTPTIMRNNRIEGNIVSNYGTGHADLGAFYTLSKAPDTYFLNNYAFGASWFGKYADEGANSLIVQNNVLMSTGNWYAPNDCCGQNTGNNTFYDNFGRVGNDQVYLPNRSGPHNNTFLRNFNVTDQSQISVAGHRVAYRAGILPAHRDARLNPLSNPDLPDGYIALDFSASLDEGIVVVNLTNFDDSEFTDVSWTVSISEGYDVSAEEEPSTVEADSTAQAVYAVSAQDSGGNNLPPTISVEVTYVNSRTGSSSTRSETGTQPGISRLPRCNGRNSTYSFKRSASWDVQPSVVGTAGSLFGIRAGGRGLSRPYDDWASLYVEEALDGSQNSSSVTVKLVSLDVSDEMSPEAGVMIRSNAAGGNTTFQGPYAALLFHGGEEKLAFKRAATGNGRLDTIIDSVNDLKLPLCLRLKIDGDGSEVTAEYAPGQDCDNWEDLEGTMSLGSHDGLDAGVIVGSGGGFRQSTGVFGGFAIGS